ncbi:Ig-like domain-containing protein, partial [Phaeodactylibacter luteus]
MKKTVLLVFFLSLWVTLSLSGQMTGFTYSLQQDPVDMTTFTATVIPNYSSATPLTISSSVYTILLPAGTVTDPFIPQPTGITVSNGSFTNINGFHLVQLVNGTVITSAGGNPANLLGFDIYQVTTNGALLVLPPFTAGDIIPLFSFRLDPDCLPGSVEILTNDNPVQQEIDNTLLANINNTFNSAAGEVYLGNDPANSAYNCPILNDLPMAVNDLFEVAPDVTSPLNILANDDYGNDGPATNGTALSIVGMPGNGTVVINDNGSANPLDDFIQYTPNAGYLGADAFTYQICDVDGDCDQASVALTVAMPDPCSPPVLNPVMYGCDGAVTISWLPVLDAMTYTVDIEDAMGNPVVDFVNMTSTSVTITPGTLTPGEDYTFAVTANCAVSNVASSQGAIDGEQIQNRLPEIVVTNIQNPLCADNDASGQFTVTVNDDCGATYDITVDGTTITADAGDPVDFTGLTAAAKPAGTTYAVTIELVAENGCTFDPMCVGTVTTMVTLIPEDATAPFISVTGDGGQTINP